MIKKCVKNLSKFILSSFLLKSKTVQLLKSLQSYNYLLTKILQVII